MQSDLTSPHTTHHAPSVAVIGAGPAGLMAAHTLALAGCKVEVIDAMPSAGRKFLLAGKGGLNLTHSERDEVFITRYGERSAQVQSWLKHFGPAALRAWAYELGIETFVGSSGRVFPVDFKAAPMLRAWLAKLRSMGVNFQMRTRWLGFDAQGHLLLQTTASAKEPEKQFTLPVQATVLALGGASWPHLGSDGAWVSLLEALGVQVLPLEPANCGFDVGPTQAHPKGPGWSERLRQEFAGQPLKTVALSAAGFESRQGEFVLTQTGIEGSLVYAASAAIRREIQTQGSATVYLDLLPQLSLERVRAEVSHPRGSRSLSSHLKSRLHLAPIKLALLHELLSREQMQDAPTLAQKLKALPLALHAPRPIAEAISSAGGVSFEAVNEQLMLRQRPGVFVAGEMLDWEAPTGGYLLTASMASARVAARGVQQWLAQPT